MSRRTEKWVALGTLLGLGLFPLIAPSALAGEVKNILVFCILALGLNVVVGYAGLLQLGIAAFFGIGAYLMGILTVARFPFQWSFWPAVAAATLGSAVAGILLAAPTLRLRGDYLAIVTLGFGEVVRFAIKNLQNITNGSQALNPIPTSHTFFDWAGSARWYYLSLGVLVLTVILLRRLEDSRIGRAWFALREDELAASCMGLNTAQVKLSAFALGAALAGLAGALYASSFESTNGPESYTFARSITILCILIIGGMGNLRGAIAGTFVLLSYENLFTPWLDGLLQQNRSRLHLGEQFKFSNLKLVVFGLALVLMMRFRPEGLFPSRRAEQEAD